MSNTKRDCPRGCGGKVYVRGGRTVHTITGLENCGGSKAVKAVGRAIVKAIKK